VIAFRVLVWSILAIGAVAFVLSCLILASKAKREIRARRDRRRRDVLEPRILSLVNGGPRAEHSVGLPNPFLTEFGPATVPSERRVREAILTDHALRLQGTSRERISMAFEEFGYVDAWLQGLRTRTWWRRAESAEKLGIARSVRATDALVEALDDPVPEVRLRAAKALGEIRGRAAVRPLLDALMQPNRWSTLRIAEILARMGNEAAEGIREVYPSLPKQARLASLDILAKLRRLESLEFLRGVLKSDDADERARAAHALGMTAHPAAAEELVNALHDPEWPVRAMAAKALGRIGSPQTVLALASALTDKDWWVRSNAAVSLKMMGPRGEKALLSVLQLSDNYARHQAVLMLEESGVVEDYVEALDAKVDDARDEAEKLVRRLVKLGRVDYLGDLAREYPNPRVRERLGKILQEQT